MHTLEIIDFLKNNMVEVSVTLSKPNKEIPDRIDKLDANFDIDLKKFLSLSDGCQFGSVFIYAWNSPINNIVDMNVNARLIREDITFYKDIILFAGLGFQSTELAIVPSLINAQGQQPVILIDTNDEPFVLPLASTVNRAISLLIKHEKQLAIDSNIDEPFPYNFVQEISNDIDLMSMLKSNAFSEIVGTAPEYQEWVSFLGIK